MPNLLAPWCSGQSYRALDPATAVRICPGLFVSPIIKVIKTIKKVTWMKVKIIPENEEIEIENGKTGEEIFKILKLRKSEYLILKNKKPIPIDLIINEDIEIIRIFSGG